MRQQQLSLGFLFKHLKPGGLYIIEDLHSSIPKFYDGFGKDGSLNNTTLKLINDYITNEKIVSAFMLPKEMKYLEEHIDYIALSKRKNIFHSTLCVIKKKE